MSEFLGHKVTIREQVVCVDPLPEWAAEFFKSYSKILAEMYGKKEVKEVK